MYNVPDIYFTPEYGRLYEKHDGGKLEVFSYESTEGIIYNQFIKRPLSNYEGYSNYYDIITPYGYGGPIILEAESAKKDKLLFDYGLAFKEYCKDNKIVSSFTRFHPIINNARDFITVINDVTPIRKTIGIDLMKDILNEEFDKTIRKKLRNIANTGVVLEYDSQMLSIDRFYEIYNQLMIKKETSNYYLFPMDYFLNLQKLDGSVELVNAIHNGELIGSVLFIKHKDFIHTHLSASTSEGNQLRVIELIKASRALKAKEEGYKWMHIGGGTTNDANDSLLQYKKKFSNTEPFDFYIGKCIYDLSAYKDLCRIAEGKKGAPLKEYFPLYRDLPFISVD